MVLGRGVQQVRAGRRTRRSTQPIYLVADANHLAEEIPRQMDGPYRGRGRTFMGEVAAVPAEWSAICPGHTRLLACCRYFVRDRSGDPD